MRSSLPFGMSSRRALPLESWQRLKSVSWQPLSPTLVNSVPSAPNATSPPLWLPLMEGMLSATTRSLVIAIVSLSRRENDETRFTGDDADFVAQLLCLLIVQ